MVGDIDLVLSHGSNITKFLEHHCPRNVCVRGMTISIGDLDWIETQAVAIAVLRVLGRQAFHHIIGG